MKIERSDAPRMRRIKDMEPGEVFVGVGGHLWLVLDERGPSGEVQAATLDDGTLGEFLDGEEEREVVEAKVVYTART